MFYNLTFVLNIRPSVSHFIELYTNGGTQTSSLVGDTRYFGEVWYNPDSIANILSLGKLSSMYRVTMDSSISHTMHVHLHGSVITTFNEMPNGLYCHNTRSYSDQLRDQVIIFSFVNTVETNQSLYTIRRVIGVDNEVTFNKDIVYLCP